MRVPDWDNGMNNDDKLISGGAASTIAGTTLKFGAGTKIAGATAAIAKGTAVGKVVIGVGLVLGPPGVIALGVGALACGGYRKLKNK